MQVQSLGQEDALEEGMATHSSILPGESHGQGSLVGYSPWGHRELDTTGAPEHKHCFSSHTWMWKLDHEEGWAPENWCFQTVMLQKTPEGPLDCKEIQPVNPRGNQPWIFIGRTVAEAEALILWPPDVKRQLTGKDPDAGKDERQKEKGWQRMRRLDSITESVDVNLSKLCEIVENRGPRCTAVHGVAKSRTQLSD